MGISLFRRFVLSGALFFAGAFLITFPALAVEKAAVPVGDRITSVLSYRTGETVDTSGGTTVLKYREGIIFRMEKGEDTEYSFYMEGPDRKWTAWSDRSYKEYTNLGRGRYTFMYRYRNSGVEIAGEGAFSFRVKAPW